ncbi:MAG: rod shape-determining protein MreC [Chitinispirillaceae bacterium]|nr:rod shape-determining protein MreC [Chitinispirillaceae bacterium]
MHWLLELLVRYRVYVSLCLTFFTSVWMITSSPELQAKTVRVLTLSLFYPFQITSDQILLIRDIFSENRRLKSKLVQLSTGVAQFREQAAENDRLRAMIGFAQESTYELIPVRVLARDPSLNFKSIVVTAGRNRDVLPFMPVVSERGVAGKVVQVMPHLSLVQLLTDPLNRISVMVQRSRVMSILETENGKEFFAHFRTYEDAVVDDTLVTSGLGGIFPKGFLVGRIAKIVDERDPLFKRAFITLFAEPSRQEELFIVKLSPQWAAFKQEADSLLETK